MTENHVAQFNIAVVTGTRAEYGLLRPVLRALMEKQLIVPHILVTGAHLSAEYGHTIDDIIADGFLVAARLDILSKAVLPGRAGTAQRTALALQLFVQQLLACDVLPDAMIVLGDRYEIFAAGQAATLLGVPLVHISGGDLTSGADDDWFRHCLSKMAKLHFPSCHEYARRLIRMGEEPGRVFNVGGLGDENVRSLNLLSRCDLSKEIGVDLPEKYALITLHPETLSPLSPWHQAETLLVALKEFPELFCLFTGSNADAGGQDIQRRIEHFCSGNPMAGLYNNLGNIPYLSAMKHASLVLGNSSSGVVESPSLGVPCVDIGQRQAGRLRPANVLHSPMQAQAIASTIKVALSPSFARAASMVKSPYNGGMTSHKIVDILTQFLQSSNLNMPKMFYDGEVPT